MLKIILFVFKHLTASLESYQVSQKVVILKAEESLAEMNSDLDIAKKLAKKMEL